jgi:hydroxymethylglutaryl-CoA lyase
VGPFIPTETKISIVRELYAAGIRRMEVTSFVSSAALPQLADASEVLAAAKSLDGLDAQCLVPTERNAERALAAGATHLAFVLSVSERHNMSNVRRTPADSVAEYARIVAMLTSGTALRLNLATAFDCPFDGTTPESATLGLLEELVDIAPVAEIALCDTTGRVAPGQVASLFAAARSRFPQVRRWAFHAHDTYGLGAANVLTASNMGVDVFDAAVAGLGGCPFAPGATGNVATEDLVWMFEGLDVVTGIDLPALVSVAEEVAAIPGAMTGGRVRESFAKRTAAIARRAD